MATPTLKECCDCQVEGLRNYIPEEATNELSKLFPELLPVTVVEQLYHLRKCIDLLRNVSNNKSCKWHSATDTLLASRFLHMGGPETAQHSPFHIQPQNHLGTTKQNKA